MTGRAVIAYLSATASMVGGAEVSFVNLIRGPTVPASAR